MSTPTFTPLQMLFIRACKSGDPSKRLLSIYRRFYCGGNSLAEAKMVIAFNLADIIDKINSVSASDVIKGMMPDPFFQLGGNSLPPEDRAYHWAMNRVRFCKTEDIQGYIPPAMWRNNEY